LSNFKPSIRATFLLTSSDTKSSIHILIETEEKKV